MFRIKICGITNRTDAAMASAAGADAVGLNFYSGSPRYVSLAAAEQVTAVLDRAIVRVGVFVNATDDEICATFDHLQLDLIQLHGDEPPEFLASLGERPILRAFRLSGLGLAPAANYLKRCAELGCTPEMVLIDADVPGQHGGTGRTADWDLLQRDRHLLGRVPLVLAGGLTDRNVAEAIRAVGPAAVDVAGGVESEPGRKDAQRVRQFVATAAQALDES